MSMDDNMDSLDSMMPAWPNGSEPAFQFHPMSPANTAMAGTPSPHGPFPTESTFTFQTETALGLTSGAAGTESSLSGPMTAGGLGDTNVLTGTGAASAGALGNGTGSGTIGSAGIGTDAFSSGLRLNASGFTAGSLETGGSVATGQTSSSTLNANELNGGLPLSALPNGSNGMQNGMPSDITALGTHAAVAKHQIEQLLGLQSDLKQTAGVQSTGPAVATVATVAQPSMHKVHLKMRSQDVCCARPDDCMTDHNTWPLEIHSAAQQGVLKAWYRLDDLPAALKSTIEQAHPCVTIVGEYQIDCGATYPQCTNKLCFDVPAHRLPKSLSGDTLQSVTRIEIPCKVYLWDRNHKWPMMLQVDDFKFVFQRSSSPSPQSNAPSARQLAEGKLGCDEIHCVFSNSARQLAGGQPPSVALPNGVASGAAGVAALMASPMDPQQFAKQLLEEQKSNRATFDTSLMLEGSFQMGAIPATAQSQSQSRSTSRESSNSRASSQERLLDMIPHPSTPKSIPREFATQMQEVFKNIRDINFQVLKKLATEAKEFDLTTARLRLYVCGIVASEVIHKTNNGHHVFTKDNSKINIIVQHPPGQAMNRVSPPELYCQVQARQRGGKNMTQYVPCERVERSYGRECRCWLYTFELNGIERVRELFNMRNNVSATPNGRDRLFTLTIIVNDVYVHHPFTVAARRARPRGAAALQQQAAAQQQVPSAIAAQIANTASALPDNLTRSLSSDTNASVASAVSSTSATSNVVAAANALEALGAQFGLNGAFGSVPADPYGLMTRGALTAATNKLPAMNGPLHGLEVAPVMRGIPSTNYNLNRNAGRRMSVPPVVARVFTFDSVTKIKVENVDEKRTTQHNQQNEHHHHQPQPSRSPPAQEPDDHDESEARDTVGNLYAGLSNDCVNRTARPPFLRKRSHSTPFVPKMVNFADIPHLNEGDVGYFPSLNSGGGDDPQMSKLANDFQHSLKLQSSSSMPEYSSKLPKKVLPTSARTVRDDSEPRIEEMDCYHGGTLSRSDCMRLLPSLGDYLIRNCNDPTERLPNGQRNPDLFVISFRVSADKVKSTKVFREGGLYQDSKMDPCLVVPTFREYLRQGTPEALNPVRSSRGGRRV